MRLRLRIRFGKKRLRSTGSEIGAGSGFGFAPLNCVDSLRSIFASRSNRPPPNPAPSSLREKQKTTRKKRGCFSSFRPFGCFLFFASGFWLRVRLWAVRPFRVGFVCCWCCAVSFGVLSFRRFLWLLWLVSVVRVLCRRRFRRSFRRVFLRLFRLGAALLSVALPVLTASLCRRLAVWARRFRCFRLRRLVRVAVRLRGVRRLWSRRLLLPVSAAVWSLLFLRRVRSVCFLPLRLRGVFRVSVRVRGLRLLLLRARAFRLSFFLAFRRVFRLLRFCPLRGRVRGFSPVPVFGLRAFVSSFLRLAYFLFSCLFSYI